MSYLINSDLISSLLDPKLVDQTLLHTAISTYIFIFYLYYII